MDYNRLYRNGHPVEKECFSSRHLGLGVFETFRARYENGSWYIMKLNSHLERLKRGAAAFKLPLPDIPALIATLKQELSECSERDLRIRIVIYPDSFELQLQTFKDESPLTTGGGALYISSSRYLPEYKHCSCLVSIMAKREALERGFQEAILVDDSGRVREGAFSNIFFVLDDGTTVTPASEILPGVTREFVLSEPFLVEEREGITPDFVTLHAVEVFLTLSTGGIVPLSKIEKKKFLGANGPVAKELIKRYNDNLFSPENLFL